MSDLQLRLVRTIRIRVCWGTHRYPDTHRPATCRQPVQLLLSGLRNPRQWYYRPRPEYPVQNTEQWNHYAAHHVLYHGHYWARLTVGVIETLSNETDTFFLRRVANCRAWTSEHVISALLGPPGRSNELEIIIFQAQRFAPPQIVKETIIRFLPFFTDESQKKKQKMILTTYESGFPRFMR